VTVGDPFTYCPTVWDYVISRFCIGSVLDLGSGCGNASTYFHRKGLSVLAVDGLAENVEKSLYPAILIDVTKMPIRTRVDLVYCQEVVEHIEEKYLDNLLASLLNGKFVLMTHALPGQPGYHHVNEQPSEYWIKHLEQRGCDLLEEDTARIRKFAELDNAPYMARSGMIFSNNSRI
jgi:SAM-dependent methyltransferase